MSVCVVDRDGYRVYRCYHYSEISNNNLRDSPKAVQNVCGIKKNPRLPALARPRIGLLSSLLRQFSLLNRSTSPRSFARYTVFNRPVSGRVVSWTDSLIATHCRIMLRIRFSGYRKEFLLHNNL